MEREERRDVQIVGLQQALALLAQEQQEQGESGAAKQHGVEQAELRISPQLRTW